MLEMIGFFFKFILQKICLKLSNNAFQITFLFFKVSIDIELLFTTIHVKDEGDV